jgi:Uma2 family endonuclease
MSRIATPPPTRSRKRKPNPPPEPAWDIARLFPDQGYWDEGDYLALDTNHLVELTDGYIEVLPMPTTSHQRIVQYLSNLLLAFVNARDLGTLLFAPLRLRLRRDKFREPDILFASAEHAHWVGEKFWTGADLLVEVVSDDPESHERDHVKKRADYAAAGVAEYWVVDPQLRRVTVLKLSGKRYVVHGDHGAGARAESASLKGFGVDVDALWKLLSKRR